MSQLSSQPAIRELSAAELDMVSGAGAGDDFVQDAAAVAGAAAAVAAVVPGGQGFAIAFGAMAVGFGIGGMFAHMAQQRR